MSEITCSPCTHFHRLPRAMSSDGAIDMSVPASGFCRGAPPMQNYNNNGQTVQLQPAQYPMLPESFPACSLHPLIRLGADKREGR